jgi:glycosyltransferase involved in cell wall biosynthesis
VVRLGWVDGAQRDALLKEATVFAYPSLYEGFGIPPLEAMAAGTPVVASDAGALPEVLGDAARLVPAGDEEALAGALGQLVEDSGAREALVARGHELTVKYSWERCATEMVALYRDVTGRA